MACIVMACIVMACIVMACIVMACIVMACIVMACIVMVQTGIVRLAASMGARQLVLGAWGCGYPPTHRIYSYGLHGYGLHGYGIHSYGLHGYGPCSEAYVVSTHRTRRPALRRRPHGRAHACMHTHVHAHPRQGPSATTPLRWRAVLKQVFSGT